MSRLLCSILVICFVGFWGIDSGQGNPVPLVHLKMDGNLTDSGTAGISGITMGSHSSFVTDTPGGGTGSRVKSVPTSDADSQVAITLPDHPALNLSGGSFTMTFWMKPKSEGLASCGMAIYDRWNGGWGSAGKGITVTSSCITEGGTRYMRNMFLVDVYSVNTNHTTEGVVVGNDAKWIFQALVYDATTSKVTQYFGYEDRSVYSTGEVALSGSAGAPDAIDLAGTIGFRAATNNRAFDGGLDDFRIYTGKLDAGEIETIRFQGISVPEPVTLVLLGLSSVLFLRRRD